ncbi:MAG: glutaminyl-peptide cyclotransferase [Salinivirgaceae bacterium]|jgi:glutamine cyclotransferase|nr:glutaminyl-peptide cyclotransferase [Salinivirgaceae bacterium]
MKNIIFAIIIAATACNSNIKTSQPDTKAERQKKKQNIEIKVTADKKKTITIDEDVVFKYKIKKTSNPDSTKVSVGFLSYKTFKNDEAIIWNSGDSNPGKTKINLTFYWGDTLALSKTMNFELLSDIQPQKLSFKVLNKWAHNVKAYTQGLEFSDGFLYEGTGNYGESMLYKIDLDNNEIVQSINLSKELFGEGITIINDKIYQLTWRSNIGYVYEKESLKKLYDFNYPTEGWGLTNNGSELIMSDGSEHIYFLDTEFIQETKKLQVYDNNGPVKHLNELEYINGVIYANIYGSESIVAFDAESGKVLKYINLSGMLDKSKVKTPIDVLNGIAFDKQKNRLIVTGKWWPYFYEIELVASTSLSNL